VPVPAVSPTVCAPSPTCTAPVVPVPQTALKPVPAVAESICRLKCPPSVVGAQTLFTVKVGLRVFVIVQVLLWPAVKLTVPSAAQSPHTSPTRHSADLVPVPAVSPTVCAPSPTCTAPVVP